MAYTTIDKPSDYFETTTYSGNNSNQSITGVGFKPDWVWLKGRAGSNSGQDHQLFDIVRGVEKRIASNTTGAESTDDVGLTAFNSNGWTMGSASQINGASTTYVGWSWKAGTSFTNDASSTGIGSLDSSGSVSTTAGFSIISWTNAGSGVATVAHGLGVTPKMIIIKSRNETAGWLTYHEAIGNTHALFLNTTGAKDDNAELFNDTSPTSTVFTTGVTGLLTGGSNLIAYCFAEKQAYSKFSSYKGNANADGTFVYLGFKPAWLMIKTTAANTSNWQMLDNKRQGFNPENETLNPNNPDAEGTTNTIDFLSNGFKLRTSNAEFNGNGLEYIYMAFAENPFVTSTGVPATAR